MARTPTPPAACAGLEIVGPTTPADEAVLTPDALAFVHDLTRTFGGRVRERLAARRERHARWRAGERLRFLPETAEIREGNWKVAELPRDLLDRRVEITGPVERKMVINALNSGARVFMADFEDSHTPTWENNVVGQRNLQDAVAGTIRHVDPQSGKTYSLAAKTATLVVRPRGWHLPEDHVRLDGEPVAGALVDFGLYFFHNARALRAKGTGPYFYLPKTESHLEVRLWNDVFLHSERALGLPRGAIKATVLIETLPAAFEMDEILFELREHSSGLNCGRWDYIFSLIKARQSDPAAVLPDRGQVTMEQPNMRAYTQLVVRTCHRRGVHAMGGMAAQIPIKGDEEANRRALDKVRADKLREVRDGHDGTWVAHPGLVPLATEIFDAHMPGPNQIDRKRDDVRASEEELLRAPEGTRTDAGLRHNVRVGILYLEAWLRGVGCVPIYNLMEDAATAEISRSQIWQWIRHGASLDDGRRVAADLVRSAIAEEMDRIRAEVGAERFAAPTFPQARDLFEHLVLSHELDEFLTLPAYRLLLGAAR